jgi:eukaryotic-like serine/threonine-protein kinase
MAAQVISGYELVETIGEGPRATVYKAWDPRAKCWVALKLFHITEIENANKLLLLKHPHIAMVFDVGQTDSQAFVVAEYLSGGSLKEHIRSMHSVGDVFPPEQIVMYAEQMALALLHAQQAGVVHDRLKTANVMFNEAGALKLTDFGAQSGASLQLQGFGKLLYEIATGEPPLVVAANPPIEAFRNDLPPEFTQLVSRLIDVERQDHCADLQDVITNLKPIFDFVSPTRISTMQKSTVLRTGPPRAATRVRNSTGLYEGRVLAGRFKIVRFIARGGMGDVYEAEDLELYERVALKTVRAEIAGRDNAMERFKREIQLARKVTHPNVCRIFDIFHDTSTAEDITFLTMELLEGETLRQRLLRSGKIATAEALPMITQMAAGLAAAHVAGIIHRDFKSSNVMLSPETSGGGAARAVVTDFGLARSALAQRDMADLSRTGDMLGTPAYMAPEQLENREITPAADIYAFGIVMYEMVTGTLPFAGDSALATALKRLHEPPQSPRAHVPELDPAWESAILRCLERHPSDRFSSVNDVVKTLSSELPIAAPVAKRKRVEMVTRRPVALGTLALVVTLVVLVALAATLMLKNRATPAAFKARRSVAVLGFKNLTGQADSAWLSTALADMLTTEIGAGEKLRAIPGESVERIFAELSLPESAGLPPDTVAKVRKYLGADVIVYGSYVLLNEAPAKIRLDLRLQDSAQGNLLATMSEEGYAADLLALVSRGGAALREKMGAGKLEPKEAQTAHAALPATPEAARFYAEGLEKLRVFDGLGARTALEKAIMEDGRHALAHAALATAWSMLGYARKAAEQSKIALELSTGLGREDQLVAAGRAREAALEWLQTVEVYRTLAGFFPDNLDYGLRLANAQTSAGDAKASLTTVERLRTFPAPDRDSPGIDLAEARAAGALSDFKRQQSLATRAAAKGNERGAKLLVAGAKLIEGAALSNLGELRPARAAFEDAKELYMTAGDRWDAVNASTNLASIVMRSGDLAEAEKIYRQSLATYRELGDRRGEAAVLTSIGTVYRNRGDFSHAKDFHTQALDIRREVGDRLGEATSRNNLANIFSLIGDSQTARKMYQEALPVFRETGERNAVATVLSNLGDLVSEEGDLTRAHELYEESRAAFEALGNKSSLAYALSRLGDLDLINADVGSARKSHEQALAIRKQVGEKGGLSESQLALAQIALHEGDAISAEASAKEAISGFSSANRPDDEATATAVLARALLNREKRAESSEAIQRAEQLSAKSGEPGVRLSIAITGASIRAALGDTAKSMKELDGVIREARTTKLIQLELEARLALAEIEIASGRFQAGRLRLDALEAEASQRGYKFIAERAAAARKKIRAVA